MVKIDRKRVTRKAVRRQKLLLERDHNGYVMDHVAASTWQGEDGLDRSGRVQCADADADDVAAHKGWEHGVSRSRERATKQLHALPSESNRGQEQYSMQEVKHCQSH